MSGRKAGGGIVLVLVIGAVFAFLPIARARWWPNTYQRAQKASMAIWAERGKRHLWAVTVSAPDADPERGTIRIGGLVQTEEQRSAFLERARELADGLTVNDRIRVEPTLPDRDPGAVDPNMDLKQAQDDIDELMKEKPKTPDGNR